MLIHGYTTENVTDHLQPSLQIRGGEPTMPLAIIYPLVVVVVPDTTPVGYTSTVEESKIASTPVLFVPNYKLKKNKFVSIKEFLKKKSRLMLVSPSFLASILLRVVYLLTERPGPVTPVPRFARAKVPD